MPNQQQEPNPPRWGTVTVTEDGEEITGWVIQTGERQTGHVAVMFDGSGRSLDQMSDFATFDGVDVFVNYDQPAPGWYR